MTRELRQQSLLRALDAFDHPLLPLDRPLLLRFDPRQQCSTPDLKLGLGGQMRELLVELLVKLLVELLLEPLLKLLELLDPAGHRTA